MIIFKQVTYKNWISFEGKEKLIFSQDPEKNITIIRGDNEVGKTAILRGITWCLYGTTKDKKSAYSDHSSRLNYAAARHGDLCYEVKLQMRSGENEFTITREAKVADGMDNSNGNFTSSLYLVKDGETFKDELAQIEINKVIEESISRFFLFDGEMLEEYEELIKGSGGELSVAIKKSIEDILRITLLKTGQNAFKQLYNTAVTAFNKDDRNGEKQKDAYKRLEEELNAEKSLEAEIKIIQEEKQGYDKKIREIMDEITSKASQRSLIADNEKLEDDNKGLANNIVEFENTLQNEVKNVYRQILGIQKTSLITKLKNKQEVLDSKLKKFSEADVYQKLLKDEEISKESRLVIAEQMPNVNLEDQKKYKEDLYLLKTDLKKLETGPLRNDPIDVLKRGTEDLLKNRARLVLNESKIKANIESLKGEDTEGIKDLAKNLEKLNKKVANIGTLLDPENTAGTMAKLASVQEKITLIRARMPKETSTTNSAKTKAISEQYKDIFDQSVNIMTQNSKESVQEEANAIYTALKEYKVIEIPSELKLEINDNYGLMLKNAHEETLTPSAGGSQIVALSLITALRNKIGVSAPLMMDTPFGRLDDKYKRALLEVSPQNCSQYILIVQPSELDKNDELETLIVNKIGQINNLKKISDEKTEIEDAS